MKAYHETHILIHIGMSIEEAGELAEYLADKHTPSWLVDMRIALDNAIIDADEARK